MRSLTHKHTHRAFYKLRMSFLHGPLYTHTHTHHWHTALSLPPLYSNYVLFSLTLNLLDGAFDKPVPSAAVIKTSSAQPLLSSYCTYHVEEETIFSIR